MCTQVCGHVSVHANMQVCVVCERARVFTCVQGVSEAARVPVGGLPPSVTAAVFVHQALLS